MQRASMSPKEKTTVTETTVMQRVNRKLQKRGRILRKARGRQVVEVGKYFVAVAGDVEESFVESRFVNLEQFARELSCLESWEVIEKSRLMEE